MGLTTVSKVFDSERQLDGSFKCNHCLRTFSTRGQYNRHSNTHSKPHRCKECGQGFAFRTDLNRHVGKHSSQPFRFHCKFDGCNFKGSSRKDNLRRHIRSRHASNDALAEAEIRSFCYAAQIERKRLTEAANLLVVAEAGNLTVLRYFIRLGVGTEARSDDQMTALHVATKKGHLECVELLLDADVDYSAIDSFGNTALHYAAVGGQNAILSLLLRKTSNVLLENHKGRTPVEIAASHGYAESVELLLAHQCNNGNSNGKNLCALYSATKAGHDPVTTVILRHGIDPSTLLAQGSSPLLCAIKTRRETLVQQFLRTGRFGAESREQIDQAFRRSASYCNEETARLFFSARCAVPTMDDFRSAQILQIASVHGNIPLARFLLQNYLQGFTQEELDSSLCSAVQGYNISIAQLLLEVGADVNSRYGLNNRTILHKAIRLGDERIVKLLLERGANAASPGSLWIAARHGHDQIVGALLDRGADINEAFSYRKTRALHEAVFLRKESTIRLLLARGADINPQGSWRGLTALYHICIQGDERIARILLYHGAGADTSIHNALRMASIYGHKTLIPLLVEHGANVNHQAKDGSTALIEAARVGDAEVVQLLLDRGADVNLCTNDKETALYKAATGFKYINLDKENRVATVNLLLSKGADVNAPGGVHGSALKGARSRGRQKIIDILLAAGALE